jgi:hypothetical protein
LKISQRQAGVKIALIGATGFVGAFDFLDVLAILDLDLLPAGLVAAALSN